MEGLYFFVFLLTLLLLLLVSFVNQILLLHPVRLPLHLEFLLAHQVDIVLDAARGDVQGRVPLLLPLLIERAELHEGRAICLFLLVLAGLAHLIGILGYA